jgi:hypothetical protein
MRHRRPSNRDACCVKLVTTSSIVTTQNTELADQAPRRFLDLLAAS